MTQSREYEKPIHHRRRFIQQISAGLVLAVAHPVISKASTKYNNPLGFLKKLPAFGIFDGSGNFNRDTLFVTVLDLNLPIILGTEIDTFVEGEFYSVVNWTISDQHLLNYTVTVSGEIVLSGSWENALNDSISLEPIEFERGQYNIILTVWDTSLNTETHSILISTRISII